MPARKITPRLAAATGNDERVRRAAPAEFEEGLPDELGEDDDDFAAFDDIEEAGADRLSIDPRVLAEAEKRGMCAQWKRLSILGKPDDTYYNYLLQRKWTPVQAGVCGGVMVLPGTDKEQPIVREGQILMWRPLKYQEHAEKRQKEKAREQVRDKERQLYESPDGTFERTQVNVRKGFAPVEGVRVAGRGGKEIPIED